jgi:sortase (surface protein transpeptidase)
VDNKTILPKEVDSFESFGQPLIEGRDQIVLVTCWPVLTTRSRLLVRGIVESNFIAE